MLNWNTPIRTACGWNARIVGKLHRTAYPMVVAIMNPDFKAEELHVYNLDGTIDFNDMPESWKWGHDKGEHPLKLHNVSLEEFIPPWTPTRMVNPVIDADIPSWPIGANPFHHDRGRMGSTLTRGWHVMHSGFDNDKSPLPLENVVFYNSRSGQRFMVYMPAELPLKKGRYG